MRRFASELTNGGLHPPYETLPHFKHNGLHAIALTDVPAQAETQIFVHQIPGFRLAPE
jgi:hypothetical protein